LAALATLRDVAGQLDDFDHLALVVEDGVVGGLQPDLLPAVTQAHEEPGLDVPRAEIVPEVGIFLVELGIAEEAMMLADHLVQPVAKAVEEVLVSGDDGAIGVEVDDRQ